MLLEPSTPRTAGPAALAAVLAISLALALLPASAFAADVVYGVGGEGERELSIGATVASPAPAVIKVEVPSSSSAVDIHIETSVIDGRFMGFTSAKGTVRNLSESTAAISAAVDSVVDGVSGKGKALGYLGVSIAGDRTVELSEGSGLGAVIIDQLEPGADQDLVVTVDDKTGGKPIPTGEYGTQATIKVRAV